jgi:hypothetical protein
MPSKLLSVNLPGSHCDNHRNVPRSYVISSRFGNAGSIYRPPALPKNDLVTLSPAAIPNGRGGWPAFQQLRFRDFRPRIARSPSLPAYANHAVRSRAAVRRALNDFATYFARWEIGGVDIRVGSLRHQRGRKRSKVSGIYALWRGPYHVGGCDGA